MCKNNGLPIGVFDSGIGGLSVLAQLIKLMPDERYIYYADNANIPYGNKPAQEIDQLVYNACRNLIERGIKALVLACNTATGISVKRLRDEFKELKIFGIEPALKPAAISACCGKVLVYCTAAAARQEKFIDLHKKYSQIADIIVLPQPDWAELIECNYNNLSTISDIILLQSQISKHFDTKSIVVGCTHYNFIKNVFEQAVPHIKLFDGGKGLAENVFSYITHAEYQNNIKINEGFKQVEYIFSGETKSYYADICLKYSDGII